MLFMSGKFRSFFFLTENKVTDATVYRHKYSNGNEQLSQMNVSLKDAL